MNLLVPHPPPFADFVRRFTRLIEDSSGDEANIFSQGEGLLRDLVTRDDWLPDAFAAAHPDRYQQFLLYLDPTERFSVVSFVWGPGQHSPVHNHTVWGMIGMMRGAELCEEFSPDLGVPGLRAGNTHRLLPGDIDFVSPRVGDIHRVSNALSDQASQSIHVYGGNIGTLRRHVFEYPGQSRKEFISGYSNLPVASTSP